MQSYQRFQCIDHTAFNTSGTNASHLLPLTKVGTHSAFGEGSHTTAHTAKQGCFGWGWHHYPRTVSHVSETLRGRGIKRQTLPFLGLGRGYSRRTQRASGTAMRLCASLSRGVAAPPGCVIFFASVEIGICTSGAHGFLCVRGRGGITTLGVLCMLPKCRTAACQSGLFVVFLRPLFTFVKAPAGHCQYPHRYRSPAAGSPADKLPALG